MWWVKGTSYFIFHILHINPSPKWTSYYYSIFHITDSILRISYVILRTLYFLQHIPCTTSRSMKLHTTISYFILLLVLRTSYSEDDSPAGIIPHYYFILHTTDFVIHITILRTSYFIPPSPVPDPRTNFVCRNPHFRGVIWPLWLHKSIRFLMCWTRSMAQVLQTPIVWFRPLGNGF